LLAPAKAFDMELLGVLTLLYISERTLADLKNPSLRFGFETLRGPELPEVT